MFSCHLVLLNEILFRYLQKNLSKITSLLQVKTLSKPIEIVQPTKEKLEAQILGLRSYLCKAWVNLDWQYQP